MEICKTWHHAAVRMKKKSFIAVIYQENLCAFDPSSVFSHLGNLIVTLLLILDVSLALFLSPSRVLWIGNPWAKHTGAECAPDNSAFKCWPHSTKVINWKLKRQSCLWEPLKASICWLPPLFWPLGSSLHNEWYSAGLTHFVQPYMHPTCLFLHHFHPFTSCSHKDQLFCPL